MHGNNLSRVNVGDFAQIVFVSQGHKWKAIRATKVSPLATTPRKVNLMVFPVPTLKKSEKEMLVTGQIKSELSIGKLCKTPHHYFVI